MDIKEVPETMLVYLSVYIATATFALLPAWYLWNLWRARHWPLLNFVATTLSTILALLVLHQFGRWDLVGTWIPTGTFVVGLCLLIVCALAAYRESRGRMLEKNKPVVRKHLFSDLLVSTICVGILVIFYRASVLPKSAVDMVFPIVNSNAYVTHGGNHWSLNYHQRVNVQRHALDITAVGSLGTRASGVYPSSVSEYRAFGQTVVSPCTGTILLTRDRLEDLSPPLRDSEHLAGNYVAVSCQNVSVLLAHLKRGSVLVQPGEPVYAGQAIAKVGNSGNTTEPHLHIHGVRGENASFEELLETGDPVPLTFDGEFLTRNSVVRATNAHVRASLGPTD